MVLGLLSDLPRKNCWTIAEWAGDRTPDGMPHLSGRAEWDADQVRDDLGDYVVEHLRDSQITVYLTHSTPRGHAAIDRELHVPRSWTSDPDRCRAAGLGDKTEFATKPEPAARMVTRFLDAGHRAAWVAGDEVYGGNPGAGGRGG